MRITDLKFVALAAAAALTLGTALPAAAYSGGQADYDGYCYAKKTNKERDDALKGAAIGAGLGAIFGKKHNKVKTAVIAGAAGAVAGYVVAKNSHEKIDCADSRYYVYTSGYYDPAPADDGYKIVFFQDRPGDVDLFVRGSNGQDIPYNGH